MKDEICKDIPAWIVILLLGAFGGGVGYFGSDEEFSWCALLIDVMTGGFVSFIVGFMLWSGNLHPYVIFAACGVSAVFSKEVLRMLRKKIFKYLQ